MTLCNISVESPQIIELSLKVGKTLANKKEWVDNHVALSKWLSLFLSPSPSLSFSLSLSSYEEAEKTFNFTLSLAQSLVEKDPSDNK